MDEEKPIVIHAANVPWQRRYAAALRKGLTRFNYKVGITYQDDYRVGGGNCLHILLGPNYWKKTFAALNKGGEDFLVVNRAFLGEVLGHDHIPDPYVSIGYNGFNNLARFAFSYGEALAGQLPYSRLCDEMVVDLQPWRTNLSGPILILLEYDTRQDYLARVLAEIGERAWTHRCHPSGQRTPLGASPVNRTLAQDAANASVVLTHHSTAAVEVLLRGTPVVTYDEESMCWPITGHSLDDVRKEDRTSWLEWLAWTQWKVSEIENGEPWEWLL